MDMGMYRSALEISERALEMAEHLSLHERMHATFHMMWAATILGDWDKVMEIWPWHVEAAATEPDVNCPNVRGGGPLGGTILAWRGDLDRALAAVPVGEEAPKRDSMFDRAIIARYALLGGRTDVAETILDSMAADPDRLIFPDGIDFYVDTLLEVGRFDEVARILPAVRRMAENTVLLGPLADRAEAAISIHSGTSDGVHDQLSAAVARFDELGVPYEAARTREMLATVAQGDERGNLLREALNGYESVGATPAAERVRALLTNNGDRSVGGGLQ
jgi:hypothetical protein